MPSGRQPLHKVTPKVKAAFLEVLHASGNVRKAANILGFAPQVLYRHRQLDPAFAAAWDEVMAIAVETVLEAEAIRRATEGVEHGIYHHCQQVAVERIYSDTLLIFLLKGWKSDRYKDRSEVFHKGTIELLRKLETIGQMTPEELQDFLVEAERHVNAADARA